MLLSGSCELFGLEETPDLSFAARDRETRLIAVVGRPAQEAVREAVLRNRNMGVVMCQFESSDHVAAALPDWIASPATLHLLGDTPHFPDVPEGMIRFLSGSEVASLTGLPLSLKSELDTAIRRSSIAATIVYGSPVSFCYAGSVTETLWDIPIDTLEGHRRRGYAALCAAYMVDHMREQGKKPVWGAEESNLPSLRLAARLGFVPVDRVVVFQPAKKAAGQA